jgi:mannose-6-phosphate isomerase-like protein (cupin superfamily)
MSNEIQAGPGYAIGSLAAIGEGPGFRKIRRALGVTAFGMNAIVLPPGYDTGSHYHEHQEETYFVHAGRIAITFGDGTTHELDPGGLARVDASTVRNVRNIGDCEATYVVVGGKDGYVQRDGVKVNPDGSEAR